MAGYRVLSELGTGAASRLYCVKDQKTNQIWALKQVKKKTDKDQRFLDQTEAEYEVGSQLNHPNIRHVEKMIKNRRVLRVSEMFLVLELVDGVPMDQYPPTTISEAAHIFLQVADGMLYMHSQGFVHADMKPNNIIVTESGMVKIIDLGQSCKIGTVKERIQGTVDYIAPEQVHRRAIMPATDVYNLGATMYWALTRQHIPTAMSNRSALGVPKDEHMLKDPTHPSEIQPHVPDAFSHLVMACVRPDPKDRPSMESVLHQLQIISVKLENSETGSHPIISA